MVKGGPDGGQMEDDSLSEEEEEEKSEDGKGAANDRGKRHDGMDSQSSGNKGIRVEEVEKGLYNIVISESIERKLWKPWWVIVKLLGRRIGYAAMKRRLENMWSKKGSIDVIDFSNDY
ncbi:hypothetical protein AHAS_Ahas13G0355200 [Arachis hypogaea]